MSELDISQVARQTGLRASTLRYYEERGLITAVGRRGLKRLFEEQVIERLAMIALGQAAGFTLDEIAAMFGDSDQPRIERDRLLEKADELDQSIRRLTAMRDGLRHAADCPHPRHMDCPKFQRIVNAAARGALTRSRTPNLTPHPKQR
ncbi:helix-turn-helix domain-containing protein [Oceanicaulis sp. LC35]|uniref:helix-turn-helix domain-containing protein n=1 Tax=Oceanicaulis sp. LC35 TaxID=3349635 RepID=UPI003F8621AF